MPDYIRSRACLSCDEEGLELTMNQSSTYGAHIPNTILKIIAWSAILVLSVPPIVYRLIVPVVPGESIYAMWLACAQAVALMILWVATWVWPAMESLRGFILVPLAICVGTCIIFPLIEDSSVWSKWWQQASWGIRLVVGYLTVHLVQIALLVLTLIGSRIGRRELFLTRGTPRALCPPTRLLFMKAPEPWNIVARKFIVVYIIIAVVYMGIQAAFASPKISQLFLYFPAIVIAAAINAFGEEFEFRSMPLARLEPVFGPGQAIIMTTVMFGLTHYFGVPGGPIGVLLVAFLGYIGAKSMVDTRGIVWAFLIHFTGDFIIYSTWAMLA